MRTKDYLYFSFILEFNNYGWLSSVINNINLGKNFDICLQYLIIYISIIFIIKLFAHVYIYRYISVFNFTFLW